MQTLHNNRMNRTLGTLANFSWLLFSRFRGGIGFGGVHKGVPKDGYAERYGMR